jgi:hypothetical protein
MTHTPERPGGLLTQSLIRLGLRASPERANAAKTFVTTLETLERKAGHAQPSHKKGRPCR